MNAGPMKRGPDDDSNRNMILLIVISLLFFLPYQLFVLDPMQRQQKAHLEAQQAQKQKAQAQVGPVAAAAPPPLTRAEALAGGQRVPFDAPGVDGSISLDGGRIDDLSLKRFRKTVDPKSPEVSFFDPWTAHGATFGVFGWTDETGAVDIVHRWQAPKGATLTPQTPLALTYETGDGLTFTRTIAIDDDYMFTVTDTVKNDSDTPRSLRAYGAVRRKGLPTDLTHISTLHEGFTGVLGGTLHELDYKNAETGKGQNAPELAAGIDTKGGWLGITDKYWLGAVVPDKGETVHARYLARTGADGGTVYEAGYVSEPHAIPAHGSVTTTARLFAGAKQVQVLQRYEKNLDILNFDKAVDWGNFFFLTRPFFALLDFLYKLVGNFGVALMLTTVVVKAALFPVAYNAFKMSSKMQKVAPKMKELQERFSGDQQRYQQEMAKLYQTEKINPVTGCLPIFLQIPVFFALYKTLLVTIEMRHQPFFGYIKDLAAPDTTSWVNLFGLLPWSVPHVPLIGGLFTVGLMPILYGVSMWAITAISPQQPGMDPMQKRIFQLMPILFTFMFASFPVGMVVYWVWSNTVTFIQQYAIMRSQGVETGLDKWLAKLRGETPAGTPAA